MVIELADQWTKMPRGQARPHTSTAVPWYHAGRMANLNPFASLGLQYCVYCQQEVDTETDATHRGQTYVYRQRCLRCGQICNWGAYQHVPLLAPVPAGAFEWCFAPGKDRR